MSASIIAGGPYAVRHHGGGYSTPVAGPPPMYGSSMSVMAMPTAVMAAPMPMGSVVAMPTTPRITRMVSQPALSRMASQPVIPNGGGISPRAMPAPVVAMVPPPRSHSVVVPAGTGPVGSLVAVPSMASVAPPVGPPLKPVTLTSGLPDLSSITKQRNGHLVALEKQENDALVHLDRDRVEQMTNIRQNGEARKAAYNLEVEQHLRRHDLALSQQHGEHMMVLNQQYSKQRGTLEQQASNLVMDYQHRKAQEDQQFQQYSLQRQMHEAQTKYKDDMVRIRASVTPPASVAIRPGVAGSVAMAPAMGTAYAPMGSVMR